MFIKTLKSTDAWSTLLEVGTVIWRPVRVMWNPLTGVARSELLDEGIFEASPACGFCTKIQFSGNFTVEPEVLTPMVQKGNRPIYRPGLTGFIRDLPRTRLWTHLVVAGHTASAKEAGLRKGGIGIHLTEAPESINIVEYLKFRSQMAEEMIYEGDTEVSLFTKASTVLLSGLEHQRVLVNPLGDDCYNYVHVEPNHVESVEHCGTVA